MQSRTRTTGTLGNSAITTTTVDRYKTYVPYDEWCIVKEVAEPQSAGGLLGGLTSSSEETITDVIGARGRYNPISHTKYQSVPINASLEVSRMDEMHAYYDGRKWDGIGLIEGHCTANVTGEIFPVAVGGTYESPAGPTGLPVVEWPNLVRDVGSRLDGAMKASTNALVVLAELGPTIAMFRQPLSFIKKTGRGGRMTPKDLVTSAAGGWLTYKYGWANFARDMLAFATVMDDAAAHFNFLSANAGRFVPCQSKQVDVVELDTLSSRPLSVVPQITMIQKYNYVRTAVFSCEIMRGDPAKLFTKMDLVKQRLGVNKVAEAIWDLIPMSFVVDWFFDVSELIAMGPVFWDSHELRRLGYSLKEEWAVDTQLEYGYALQGLPALTPKKKLFTLASQRILKKYTRSPGFPEGGSSGLFGNLRLSNLADGAALIAQRIS